MNITVNGQERFDLEEGMSLQALLVRMELPLKKLAIERNREIVPKSTYEQVILEDGDRLEIVHFIGGG